MVLVLLAGPIWHHQIQPLVGNLLFWGALAAVFMGALGLMVTGDRDARATAQAELSPIWAEFDAQIQARLLAETVLALLSSLRAADATQAIAKQKSNFSPPAAPGGRSLPHLCLTPRLCSRPRAAAQRLPREY
ncbi:MAG: hypothetical protein HKL99_12870 [Burkholderiales bacterium]|nr:hypothetical protein [Burkholderiales bacterium]